MIQVVAIASLAAAEYVELYVSVNQNSLAADSAISAFEIALLGV